MFNIIISNFSFWLIIIAPISVALYFFITNKELVLKELGIIILANIVFASLVFSIAFSQLDLIDTEYINTKAKYFEKYEEWTEEVRYTESYDCGSSKEPKTCYREKTRHDYHPEYFQLVTENNKELRISSQEFYNAAERFNKTKINIYRPDKVSWNDGDKFVSTPNIDIPTSYTNSYTNYVTAAKDNVINSQLQDDDIKHIKVPEYPKLKSKEYGQMNPNRFLSDLNISYNKELNLLAMELGKSKQCNPIIITTYNDRSYKDIVQHKWKGGKKNDITLILGLDNNNTIVWSDVITYTNNSDFIVNAQNDFKGTNINDISTVINKFKNNIVNNYTRKPMEEFEYLTENISLDILVQVLIILLSLALNLFLIRLQLKN